MMITNTCYKFLDLVWQGVAHPDHPGRLVGPRLLGRSEISPVRITTVSNETLQSFPAGSLSGMLDTELWTKYMLNILEI